MTLFENFHPIEKNFIPKRRKFIPFHTIKTLFLAGRISDTCFRNYEIRNEFNYLHFELKTSCNDAILYLSEKTWTVNKKCYCLSPERIRGIIYDEVPRANRRIKGIIQQYRENATTRLQSASELKIREELNYA